MMIRWKGIDLSETTVDDLAEVTLIGVYGRDEFTETQREEIMRLHNGDIGYNLRQAPQSHTYHQPNFTEVDAVVMVRPRQGIAQLYEIQAAMGWILNDQGDTIDKLF